MKQATKKEVTLFIAHGQHLGIMHSEISDKNRLSTGSVLDLRRQFVASPCSMRAYLQMT